MTGMAEGRRLPATYETGNRLIETSLMTLALQWLNNARSVMDQIEATQMDNIRRAAELMAGSIEAERWVHTFGCGHATIPVEEMYPRIGGFVPTSRPWTARRMPRLDFCALSR